MTSQLLSGAPRRVPAASFSRFGGSVPVVLLDCTRLRRFLSSNGISIDAKNTSWDSGGPLNSAEDIQNRTKIGLPGHSEGLFSCSGSISRRGPLCSPRDRSSALVLLQSLIGGRAVPFHYGDQRSRGICGSPVPLPEGPRRTRIRGDFVLARNLCGWSRSSRESKDREGRARPLGTPGGRRGPGFRVEAGL